MGIPSYFSHIIKNHPNILRTLAHHRETQFTALYMDCNSIIYDAVRTLESGEKSDAFQDKLIDQVILKIKHYISIIKPSRIAYISFDGVAPLAKMDQQKERRYRSAYLASALNTTADTGFSTTAITPGTEFMVALSARVNAAFSGDGVTVSAADEPGEGEHKMFTHLRKHSNRKDVVAVYGLDADLIMLSMFHCFHCFNIHIFREAPEFSAHILPAGLKARNKSDLLFVDTFKFTRSLLAEMGFDNSMTSYQVRGRIYDYVFMCFMLGNDFMPHFLALNIRTAGIGRLMDTYHTVIAKYPDRSFISANMTIRWKYVSAFIDALAKNEHGFIKEEMAQRAKTAKGIVQSTSANSLKTSQDKEAALMNIPMLFRQDEEYINPAMPNWQTRYYDVAFHSPTTVDVHAVCRNYCEGLEWTFKYYTAGCPHWQWKYEYSYPPLLQDLAVYLSNVDADHMFFNSGDAEINPCSPTEQLLYVLPKTHHYLLPEGTVVDAAAYPDMDKLQFSWMGCRYFWESHLVSTTHVFSHLPRL